MGNHPLGKKRAWISSLAMALSLLAPLNAFSADGDSNCDLPGSGTALNPWQIATSNDLKEIGQGDCAANFDVSQYYILTQNIVLPAPWTPLTTLYVNPGYVISLDGNDKTISGLQVNVNGYAGLFSDIRGALIKDLTITGSSVTGTGDTGALAGFVNESTLQNIKVQVVSVTSGDYTGGVVGRVAASNLANLTVLVDAVTGDQYVGGVAGALQTGNGNTVSHVVATNTDVNGDKYVGGLFGGTDGYSSFEKLASTNATVTQTGGDGRQIGGLIGLVNTAASLSKILFDGEVIANATDTVTVGLLVGEGNSGALTMTDTSAFGQVRYTTANSAPASNVGQAFTNSNFTRALVRGRASSPNDSTISKHLQPIINQPNPGRVTITSSFWDSDYLTLTGLGWQATSKTSSQLKTTSTYTAANWSITENVAAVRAVTATETWFINEQVNSGYPVLTWAYQAGVYAEPCEVGRYSVDGMVPCLTAGPGTYVAYTGQTSATDCPVGYFQANSGSMYCVAAQPGYFVPNTGSSAETPCPAGQTSNAAASACFSETSAYSGPTIQSVSNKVRAGETITVSGSRLTTVKSLRIDGVDCAVEILSDSQMQVVIPVGARSGLKDIKVTSDAGTLTVQGFVYIDATISTSSIKASIKRIDSKSRVLASGVVGVGKVQFFLNGKEIAWVNAATSADPKLRTTNGSSYLIRTVTLATGKNVLEIWVDGVREKRAVYRR